MNHSAPARHLRVPALLRLSALLAFRLLRTRRERGFLSFIALVSVAGLLLGVAILVVVLSMMNGFERELRERVLGVLPHAVLTLRNPATPATRDELMRTATAHPQVAALAPLLGGSGLLLAGQRVRGVAVSGVEPELEAAVSILPDFMQEGEFAALHQPYALLLGARLAAELKVRVGDRVSLVAPEALVSLLGVRPRMKRFTVAGIFRVGSDADLQQVFVHRRDALRLLRNTGTDGFRLKLHDLFQAHLVLQELVAEIGIERVGGQSWMFQFGSLHDAIRLQKSTLWLLLALLVLVAAFNLVSTLVLMVGERRGEIAVLRSLGASLPTVVLTFVFYGLLTGLTGISLGLLLGSLLAVTLSPLYALLVGLTGWTPMNEYFINYLPSQLLFDDLWKLAALALLLCLLATVYPALRVARLRPVELLRHE